MTACASRRRFLIAASATSAMLSTGLPLTARAQGSIALRISSSLTADQNSAHYIWYQRFASNLKSAAGSRIATDFFPNSQLGKEADHKASCHIDRQRTIRKAHAFNSLLNISACKITQHRTYKSANADEKDIRQITFPLFDLPPS